MQLASVWYVLFLAGVGLATFATPQTRRWVPLLVGSYAFYALLAPRYTLLLAAMTLVSWVAARTLGVWRDRERRARWLFWLTIAAVLTPLAILKYAVFVEQIFAHIAPGASVEGVSHFRFILPVGISFFSVQIVGYLIDVYQGTVEPEPSIGRYATFVAFFPHVTAGPIGRSGLLTQLESVPGFDYDRVSSGVKLAAWGLFKKIVIADRLGAAVDNVYAAPEHYSGVAVIFVCWLYMFQVYADFSGYSDMAIGSARVLGVNLEPNFAQPYLSRSIGEYWRRWHLSFSTWLNEYVYFPLSAVFRRWNRVGAVAALLVTFLISGLWHGAAWTFVVFGMAHGTMLVFELLTNKWRSSAERRSPRLVRSLSWGCTLTFLCLVDVLFRAPNLGVAGAIYGRIAAGVGEDIGFVLSKNGSAGAFKSLLVGVGFTGEELILALLAIVTLCVVDVLQERLPMAERLRRWPSWARWSIYYATTASILFLGSFNRNTAFVYYQF